MTVYLTRPLMGDVDLVITKDRTLAADGTTYLPAEIFRRALDDAFAGWPNLVFAGRLKNDPLEFHVHDVQWPMKTGEEVSQVGRFVFLSSLFHDGVIEDLRIKLVTTKLYTNLPAVDKDRARLQAQGLEQTLVTID
jgi:hypothetical protein